MTSELLMHAVRRHCSCCFVSSCSEGKCEIRLPQSCSCLSGTLYQSNHNSSIRLCDCIVFWSQRTSDIASAVELKGGGMPANRALDQLQGGANVVEQMVEPQRQIRFYAVLVLRRLHPMEARVLRRRRITFRGRARLAIIAHCGDRLEDVLRSEI